jgi:hypothetical protein
MLSAYVYLWRTSILPFWQEDHVADRLLFLIYANHIPFEYFEVMTKATRVMAANMFIVNVRVTTLCGSLVGEYQCLGLHSAYLRKAEHQTHRQK